MFSFFRKEGKPQHDLRSMSDLELIGQYKSDLDQRIIAELFKRYTHLVFGLCLKYLKNEEDSKDALLEIFEKLITDLPRHEITNFKSWLYSVSKNHCLMILRKVKREILKEDVEKNNSSTILMENEDDVHQEFDGISPEKLRQSIEKLKEEQRICIELFYLDEKSYKEIADTTGYEVVKVKSYIQNGKRNLKMMLSK